MSILEVFTAGKEDPGLARLSLPEASFLIAEDSLRRTLESVDVILPG